MRSSFLVLSVLFAGHFETIQSYVLVPSSCAFQSARRVTRKYCRIHASSTYFEERKQDVNTVLKDLYDWSSYTKLGGDGYCTTAEEESSIEAATGSFAHVYGEITLEGMRSLSSAVSLCSTDSFFDLGSGVGRCVLQAHLEWNVELTTGIELAESRHSTAEKARIMLRTLALPEVLSSTSPTGKIEFFHQDIMDADLAQATVVWCAALMFSESFMHKLAQKLDECGRLRAVVTLQAFPNGLKGFVGGSMYCGSGPDDVDINGKRFMTPSTSELPSGLDLSGTLALEMSWAVGKDTRAYLYTRSVAL